MAKNVRVLFARPALDGHDRGIITIMSRCRDHGIEVVYIYFNDPREVAAAAVEEDVECVGVTCSMGEHLRTARELISEMGRRGTNVPVIFGGVIPTVDVERLEQMGVRRVFGPGSSPGEAVDFIAGCAAVR